MTYKTGDTIQTTRKLNQMPIGTRGVFVKGWSSGAVVVNFGGNDRVVFMTDIAPAASEPTAEAAQPAHRFPVGAVVAWTMERDTEKREELGTIRKHYITMSGKLQYSLKIRSYSVLAYEHELRAL